MSCNIVRVLFFVILFIIPPVSFAQGSFTVSGTVRSAKDGELLIGVPVRLQELSGKGAFTNEYGFFSLTLPEGHYTLVINYLGYEPYSQSFELKSGKKIDVELKEILRELKEVEVTAEKADQNVTSNEMSVNRMEVSEIKKIPVLFGEQDVLKTLQLLPGIKSAGEGNAGYYVRGGGADQNLILLDEAPVYNPSHLAGFFSVFNSDAIKDVTVYKGGMPAEYGGRLSSVLDVRMNEGNSKKLAVNGGAGLIFSRLTVEAPIIKDRSSFIVSGRRTYLDVFAKLSSDSTVRSSVFHFYDLNIKTNYKLNDKNQLFLSGYFGRDNFGLKDLLAFGWGNATFTLRWNHIYNGRLFSNTSLVFSNYDYLFSLGSEGNSISLSAGIRNYNIKQNYQYYVNPNLSFKFGFNSIYYIFRPSEVTIDTDNFNFSESHKRFALENSVYFSSSFTVKDRFSITPGLRLSLFNPVGKGQVYDFDAEGRVTDTTYYSSGEIITGYFGPEPRLMMSWLIDDESSLKASFTRTYQYLQLLSNSTSSSPMDLWMPSSKVIKPQSGNQYALGYFRNFKGNRYETSAEIYYKTMDNVIDYRNNADFGAAETIEGQIVQGKGWAYGLELFAKKKTGKVNGWIGYTISRTFRRFEEINGGDAFPAKYDIIHDISIVAIYDISKRVSLSSTWVFNTGNAVTFPSGKYEIDGQIAGYYTEKNGYRMPSYHRMDLGLTLYGKPRKRYESNWNFSVYNVYFRDNAYSIAFRRKAGDPEASEAVQITLFKFVPSVTYNFKF